VGAAAQMLPGHALPHHQGWEAPDERAERALQGQGEGGCLLARTAVLDPRRIMPGDSGGLDPGVFGMRVQRSPKLVRDEPWGFASSSSRMVASIKRAACFTEILNHSIPAPPVTLQVASFW
jgi:hypothetical protein